MELGYSRGSTSHLITADTVINIHVCNPVQVSIADKEYSVSPAPGIRHGFRRHRPSPDAADPAPLDIHGKDSPAARAAEDSYPYSLSSL